MNDLFGSDDDSEEFGTRGESRAEFEADRMGQTGQDNAAAMKTGTGAFAPIPEGAIV